MDDNNEISNYKYIKTIGEGTFGKVKLAIHNITGEKVAIKILQKNLIKDKNEYNRIEKEIKYLKLFNHPNIIQIYEVIESPSSFYIIMEYAEGGELFNYIVEKEKLSEKESSFYFYQIIQGVKEIHNKKICHRDIKPENLLLMNNKVLKIIDFGLSSEYDNYLTTPCGSPCYASPEMIKGKKYNGLSIDLWACGIILFAMLCGYLPFDDKNNNELFKKIVECKIDYPEEDEVILSDISLDLINKILTPNPKKRIGLEDILAHPFMNYGKKMYNEVIKTDKFNQEELIIDYMINELGFNNKNNLIEQCIHSNRHNKITTTYNLLKQKFNDGRLNYSFKVKIIKQINKKNSAKNITNSRNNNNNNISNKNISFNNDNNTNSYINDHTKKNIRYIKKKFNIYDDKFRKNINITYNNFDYRKRSKTSSSCSHSKKNLLSLKEMIKEKSLIDRNNIIIINNTNMIQQPEKIKPIYNNLFFKNNNDQYFRKIETSVSLEKSMNKINNIITTNSNINNNDINKLNNTYHNNKNNTKKKIKVCLKKDDKNENPFVYFKKIKDNDFIHKKKFIYLPSQKISYRLNNRKSQKRNHYQNDFLSYKKNSTGIGGFTNHFSNIYSFDGNFNTSLSNNYLNGISYDTTNFNYTKNNENGDISSSRNKKNNIKNILITDDISNKYQYKEKLKSGPDLLNTLEINKENTEILNNSLLKIKNKIDINKNNYLNIEKICKKIFKQNNKRHINYISNNKKNSYDNNIKESNRINENFKNKNLYINHHKTNKDLLNIKKEYLFPSTSSLNKVQRNINIPNIPNINNLSNKIIVKNTISKNTNNNFIQKKIEQNQKKISNDKNCNIIKNLYKNNDNFYKKINNCESFQEKNNKKISKLKELSYNGNNKNIINNKVNINTVSTANKKSKINKKIKDILSLKKNMKNNNKERAKNKKNIYNIFQNEKENILMDSSSRNIFNKSNYNNNNYSITTREKRLYVSRNNNYDNNITKSSTVLLEQNKNIQNKSFSSGKKIKDNSKCLNKNINNKKQNLNEKFLSMNTEMTFYQILNKLEQFCKENKLEIKKEGKNNYIIYEKNYNNSFSVELIDSSYNNQLNIVKFYQGKNTGEKMRGISTKLFIEIANA